MVDRNLNLVLAPQFVVNIVHEMGGEGGLTIVAGIASSGGGGSGSMSDAAVKAAYERNANTNEFDDAEQTKLAGIASGADVSPTPLTDAQIKTQYELNADTNVFNDLAEAKLGDIEDDATADQTGAEIKSAYQGEANAFTDAQFTKLAGVATGADVSPTPLTNAQIKTQYELNANTNVHTDAQVSKLAAIEASATADQTDAEIKTAYELNANTNAFTDAEKTSLGTMEDNSTADQTDAEIRTAVANATDSNVYTDDDEAKLGLIEALATADQTDAQIETAYNAQVAKISGPEITAGTEVTVRRVSPADLKAIVLAHETGGGGGDPNPIQVSAQEMIDGTETALRSYSPDDIENMATIHGGGGGGMSDAEVKIAYENNANTNEFDDAEQSKLAAIEAGATADMTGAEIKTAYQAEANAFTDAKNTKLTGIETSATADQTNAEIRAAVAAATDSNVFQDADASKMDGIESGATTDQTGAEIKSAYQAEVNAYTDAKDTKLAGIATGADVSPTPLTDAQIKTQYELNANTNVHTDAQVTKLAGIDTGAKDDQTGAEIKALYEGETNAYTDAKDTKLTGIETSAKDDQTDAEIATAYGNEVGQISGGEITAGTETALRTSSPADLKAIVLAHETGGGSTTSVNYYTADHTLTLTDADDIVEMDSASANELSIPTHASVPYAIGTIISVSMLGAGITTVTAVATVTLNGNVAGSEALGAIFDGASLYKRGTNDWIIQGAINGVGGMSDAEVKTAYENNANTNEFSDAEQTKLAGIETSAEVNPTNAEIRTAVEAATDSNVFTDTESSKLAAIEASATADQTDSEIETAYNAQVVVVSGAEMTAGTEVAIRRFSPDNIENMIAIHGGSGGMSDAEVKTAYENNANTNEFDDTEQSKLAAIEDNATADQTDAEIRAAVEAATDSNVFTDAESSKLAGLEAADTEWTGDQTFAAQVMLKGEISPAQITANQNDWNPTGLDGTVQIRVDSDAAREITGLAGGAQGRLVVITYIGATQINLMSQDAGSIGANRFKFATGDIKLTPDESVFLRYDGTNSKWRNIRDHVPLTGAQIKTLYEGEADAFTDAKNTKLTGIETLATADQTNAEIRAAVAAATDSNVFTDAQQTSLGTMEDGATADQTNTEIRTAVEAAADSNVFTDADHTKLNTVDETATPDQTDGEIETAYNNQVAKVSGGEITAGTEATVRRYSPLDVVAFIAAHETGGGGMSDAEVKTAYENNANTNEFDDTEQSKLAGIATGATIDQTGAQIKTLYQGETNAFTDAKNTKLTGIDTGAKDDQTGAEIKAAYETEANAFTDGQFTKLAGIDTGAKDDQTGAEIKTAYQAEANAYTDTKNTKLAGIDTGAKDDQTGAEIKAAYEGETNAYTNTKNTKLGTIEDSADVTDTANVTAAGAAMLGGAGMTVGSSHFNVQTGTSYELVASDNGKTVTLNNASAIVLTVPTGLGAGFRCSLLQLGAGQVTVTASGTTLNSLLGFIKVAGQHGVAGLLATTADTFALAGDLIA